MTAPSRQVRLLIGSRFRGHSLAPNLREPEPATRRCDPAAIIDRLCGAAARSLRISGFRW